jgi:hypothetical protein
MSPRAPAPTVRPHRSVAAKFGFVLGAFAVFVCGWLPTRSSDWKTMVLYSVLAIGAAAVTSAFSRMAR